MKSAILIFAVLIITEPLLANVLWSSRGSTPPRTREIVREDGAPCGTSERAVAAQFNPGAQIDVEWDEIIPQAGYFEIYFSQIYGVNIIWVQWVRLVYRSGFGFKLLLRTNGLKVYFVSTLLW